MRQIITGSLILGFRSLEHNLLGVRVPAKVHSIHWKVGGVYFHKGKTSPLLRMNYKII